MGKPGNQIIIVISGIQVRSDKNPNQGNGSENGKDGKKKKKWKGWDSLEVRQEDSD